MRTNILRRAKTGEEIAAELGVSLANLYNWRRAYGGMDTDAAKELKALREQKARLRRLLAEAELVKDALREHGQYHGCTSQPRDRPTRVKPPVPARIPLD